MRSKVSSGSFLRSKSNPNIVFSQSTVAVTFRKWWTFIWRWHYFCRQTRKKYTPFISPEPCSCLGSLAGSPLYLEGIKAIENTKKKSWNKLESRPFDWQERCFFFCEASAATVEFVWPVGWRENLHGKILLTSRSQLVLLCCDKSSERGSYC